MGVHPKLHFRRGAGTERVEDYEAAVADSLSLEVAVDRVGALIGRGSVVRAYAVY